VAQPAPDTSPGREPRGEVARLHQPVTANPVDPRFPPTHHHHETKRPLIPADIASRTDAHHPWHTSSVRVTDACTPRARHPTPW
jgi:hypothetical protein